MPDSDALTLSFEVSGLPPVRTEASSLLAGGHRQAVRVRTLLKAARDAAQRAGWAPPDGPVAVELVLHCPPGHRPSDAIALLGGVCTVLSNRRRVANIGPVQLGTLVDVALYDDDRQIRRLGYREEPTEQMFYRVAISALPAVV